jgi:hypothetical protein
VRCGPVKVEKSDVDSLQGHGHLRNEIDNGSS